MKKNGFVKRFLLSLLATGAFFGFGSCDYDGTRQELEKYLNGGVIEVDKLASVIGCGYDLAGKYADAQSVKPAVLDFEQLRGAGRIRRNYVAEADFSTISGSSVTDYQENLSNSITASVHGGLGSLFTFSTEITTSFAEERARHEEYSFASSRSSIIKDAYFVDDREPGRLLSYVTPAFQSDRETMSAGEFIARYGTHVMLGGLWGARLEYNLSAMKKGGSDEKSCALYIKVMAEANVGAINTGASVGSENEEKFKSSFEATSMDVKTRAVGGKPEYAQHVQTKADYDSWIESIDGNEAWINYYQSENTLIPIYEFIVDETKKIETKDAFNKYFEDKKIIPERAPAPVSVVTHINVTEDSRERNGRHFATDNPTMEIGDPLDFNSGAGGAFIFVQYDKKTTAQRTDAVAEVKILRGQGSAPSGWKKCDLDMNRKAGGKYLFLIYRMANEKDTRVIDFIGGKNGRLTDNLPAGYSWVTAYDGNWPQDLNEDAGGAFEYLTVHHIDLPK
jgi:hypothetical protein